MIHSRQAVIVIAALGAVAVAPAALKHSRFRLNSTASIPEGIYRIVPNGSRYAAICLPEAVLDTAQKAGLFVPPGECPDGREPILKSVYRATLAAPITFTPGGFIIGNRLLANTAAKLRSKTGEPLNHQAFGIYGTGLWAISDYNPDSFDSRYFGPVPDSSVRYFAVPFFLF
jgi:conjugative transfer signal peptidase TraF